ncbi:Prephenate dehydratase-domain-containing protein [Lophiotrema nucula]|uniref:prephenate dehydratase n=1 Tax=Lophiotrema nucula TaxID=690887 RepID=A0A6A5Z7V9_9PLEO|nr:Prephenate dehydratase-domain-containing protein [Lophiotrema nucula]
MGESNGVNKPLVAFLGPKASYTHQATLDVFDEAKYILAPQIGIEDVFSAVQSGHAHRGVVPFENSSNGSVVFTLDLFADLYQKYPDILVCGEAYISVQHCLLGRDPGHHPHSLNQHVRPGLGLTNVKERESPLSSGAVTPTTKEPVPSKPRAAPLADLSKVKKIYSHPQAWGQCKSFLNTYLKSIERQDVSSTSKAAQLVADDESGTSAAISSIVAAKVCGLDILAKGIEDRSDNTTRFFVLQNRSPLSPSPSTSVSAGTHIPATEPPPQPCDPSPETENYKTLISFTVDHANPGALAHSLSVFEQFGLNLTSINTRPSGVENWNYIFFVEIKGRKLDGSAEGAVNKALLDLGKVCRGWRWLGSWENRLTAAGSR